MSNLDFQRQAAELSRFSELQDELLTGPMVPVFAAAADLTADELRQARDSILFVNAEAANDLQLGNDLAATAADLQSILGLTEAGDQCILRFATATSDINADVDLKSTDGGSTFIDIALYGGADAATQVLFNATAAAAGDGVASGIAIVQATAEVVTAGAEVIVFNVLVQGRVSA